ncbi:hypothetical protein D6D17_09751 [Aureobasidium pullulans]|uniref:Uncharacterized protein n=1 Tax=Aureobasidium pullulans TaxID=5580 RepID=A0A4S9W7C6_AURPU|nr:hypothetical protein D6D17_09751 [Aureobasidium pullulans]THZ61162.1 hypothetical protein D6C85_09602 [Aureobasidium pullulans]
MRGGLQNALDENDSRVYDAHGQTTITYNIAASERIVLFLAHWVNTVSASDSLEVSMQTKTGKTADNVLEIQLHFHLVINHFSDMDKYNSDILDSLIDWYILWLRENKEKGLDKIFKVCMQNDQLGQGGLIRVCANVFSHHKKELFTARTQERLALWLHRYLGESALDTIPGDVLSEDFDQFCAYHQHGQNVCYEEKK